MRVFGVVVSTVFEKSASRLQQDLVAYSVCWKSLFVLLCGVPAQTPLKRGLGDVDVVFARVELLEHY